MAGDLDLGRAAGRRLVGTGRDTELRVVAAALRRLRRGRRRPGDRRHGGGDDEAAAHRDYLSSPSAFIASCTLGRAAMRVMNAATFLNAARSRPTCLAQLVTVNR